MYQIDNSSAAAVIPASTAAGTPGFFTDGNPATGVAPTILPAEFMNMVMMEILGVLSAGGVTPSKSSFTQLTTAIRAVSRQLTVVADTGTAGIYSAVNTPALTVLPSTGYVQRVSIANLNPGASTYSPDGLAAKPIYGLGLQPLQGGELPVGVAILMYLVQAGVNGGNGAWILIESLGGASQVAPATKSQHAPQFSQIATVAGAFKNLKASTTGLDANISVSADEIVLESAANLYVTLRSVALTINSATVGANGLDTGTLAASTWYSVWTIWNGTTKAGLISLSATAPTLPSGYTHMARTGWIRTDGTASKYPLSFIQVGRVSAYKPASGSNVTGCPVMTSGAQGNISTPTWLAIPTANFVPPTACGIDLVVAVFSTTTSAGNAMAAPNNAYGAFNSTTNPPPISFGASVAYNMSMKSRFILESGNIYYAGTNTTASLQCVGWEDNL